MIVLAKTLIEYVQVGGVAPHCENRDHHREDKMIYTLGPPRHARLKREYATTSEEIEQMAKDRCWGTTCSFPNDWDVHVDMVAMTVNISAPKNPEYGTTTYKILAYKRVV